MRNTLRRITTFLAGLFASAPTTRRSTIRARHEMYDLAHYEPTKSGRTKCGGPNWLKIALNSRR